METTTTTTTPEATPPILLRVVTLDPLIVSDDVDAFALRRGTPVAVFDPVRGEIDHVSFLGEGLLEAFSKLLPNPHDAAPSTDYEYRLSTDGIAAVVARFPDLWPWANIWVEPTHYVRYMQALGTATSDSELLQRVRQDLVRRIHTSGDAYAWASFFLEDKDKVKHRIADSGDALRWALLFPEDSALMAPYINQDDHAYRFACLKGKHRHLVRHVIRESRTAFLWAREFPGDREHMRQLISGEKDAIDWAETFPDDRDLMRLLIFGSYFAYTWAYMFENERHLVRHLVVESETAMWWGTGWKEDRGYMLPLVTRSEDAAGWLDQYPGDGDILWGNILGAAGAWGLAERALDWVSHNRSYVEDRGDLVVFLQMQKTAHDKAAWVDIFPEDLEYFAAKASLHDLELLYDVADTQGRDDLRKYFPPGHPYQSQDL